ncbi:hypothetical protein ACLMJK_009173 [Lecanora helva]
MSRSLERIKLPSARLPEISDVGMALKVAGDLNTLIRSWSFSFDDFVYHTTPTRAGVLEKWLGPALNSREYLDKWIMPLFMALMARNPKDLVTFESNPEWTLLKDTIRVCGKGIEKLARIIREFARRTRGMLGSDPRIVEQALGVTPRSFQEILIQAILMTCEADEEDTENVKLPSSFADWPRQWASDPEARPNSQSLDVGYPASLCALGLQTEWLTGSTLIYYGALAQLELVNVPRDNIQVWQRYIRQQRYTDEEQQIIKALIVRELDAIKANITSIESPAPVTLPGGRIFHPPKAKRIVAQRKALKLAVEEASTREPSLLQRIFMENTCLGQNFEGQSLDIKRKCPICQICFPFPVSRMADEPRDYLDNVAELDSNPAAQVHRGHCEEALVVAQAISRLEVIDDMKKDLSLVIQ